MGALPRDERRNVIVKQAKIGFTASITTSASGEVVLTQFIYKTNKIVWDEWMGELFN